jgi:hypothetical protein
LSGGGGNDTLNSVDKRKDALVSGGAVKNSCRIDPVDRLRPGRKAGGSWPRPLRKSAHFA